MIDYIKFLADIERSYKDGTASINQMILWQILKQK